MRENIQLTISARRLTQFLLMVVAFLLAMQLIMWFFVYALGYSHVYGLASLFHLGSERNAPTWFSSFLLLLASILLALIALEHKTQNLPMQIRWMLLAAIFLFLSLDEAFGIHDLVYHVLDKQFVTEGVFTYSWVIPYGILCVVFLIAYLPLLAYLPAQTRRLFVVAGLIYVGAALGLEMAAGAILNWDDWYTRCLVAVEETAEMCGIVIFIYALVRYMRDLDLTVVVQLDG